MRRVKWAVMVSLVLIGAVVFGLLWVNLQGRKTMEVNRQAPKISDDSAKMRLEKVFFVEDKEGRKTWELEAKSVQQYEDQNVVVLEDIKLTVHTKEGRSFVVSGKQGKIHQDSKDMELVGDVRVVSDDGYRLKTNSVTYHHGEKKVMTSDPVEVEGDQLQLVGKGLLIDMEARTFKVLHDVKTRWRLEKKE